MFSTLLDLVDLLYSILFFYPADSTMHNELALHCRTTNCPTRVQHVDGLI